MPLPAPGRPLAGRISVAPRGSGTSLVIFAGPAGARLHRCSSARAVGQKSTPYHDAWLVPEPETSAPFLDMPADGYGAVLFELSPPPDRVLRNPGRAARRLEAAGPDDDVLFRSALPRCQE
jgi:hypothetical protein